MTKKVGIIVGSTRSSRISIEIAKWVNEQLHGTNFTSDLIDLAEINLPMFDEPEVPARGTHHYEHTKQWSQLVKQYDGFIVVFPQYNWGYPSALKNAFDYLYDEWQGKPISLMPYGSHGGLQAMIAFQLVVQGLKMKQLAVNPMITIKAEMLDEHEKFIDVETALKDQNIQINLLSQELDNEFAK